LEVVLLLGMMFQWVYRRFYTPQAVMVWFLLSMRFCRAWCFGFGRTDKYFDISMIEVYQYIIKFAMSLPVSVSDPTNMQAPVFPSWIHTPQAHLILQVPQLVAADQNSVSLLSKSVTPI